MRPGDLFLVASDGLTGMVEDRRLAQLLGSRAEPERKVQSLIAEANGRGGLDNITAILVQVLEIGPSSDDPNLTVETRSVG
jgi:protein phosphatase